MVSKGVPGGRWEVFCEEDFGIGDLAKLSSINLEPFILHAEKRLHRSLLVWSFTVAGGPLLRILERILFGFFDFGSQRGPKFGPDYTLPILHINC